MFQFLAQPYQTFRYFRVIKISQQNVCKSSSETTVDDFFVAKTVKCLVGMNTPTHTYPNNFSEDYFPLGSYSLDTIGGSWKFIYELQNPASMDLRDERLSKQISSQFRNYG